MPPKKGDAPAINDFALPFLHRQQLDFESGVAFELEVAILAGSTGTITLAGATKAGFFKFSIKPAVTGFEEDFVFRIPDIPLFISLQTFDTEHLQGTTWAQIFLRIAKMRAFRMCSGWVTPEQSLSYPSIQAESPRQGGGLVNFITGANPAAGAEVSDTLSTSRLVRIQSAQVRLVTDGTAANRRVHFRIVRSTGLLLWEGFSDVDQTASTTIDYILSPVGAVPDSTDNGIVIIPIPPNLLVKPGWIVKTVTTNIQAGDNFAAASYMTEEWFGTF